MRYTFDLTLNTYLLTYTVRSSEVSIEQEHVCMSTKQSITRYRNRQAVGHKYRQGIQYVNDLWEAANCEAFVQAGSIQWIRTNRNEYQRGYVEHTLRVVSTMCTGHGAAAKEARAFLALCARNKPTARKTTADVKQPSMIGLMRIIMEL